MIEMMQDLLRLDSPREMCRELGLYLGMEQPVSLAVLRRAQRDDRFALHLVMSRGSRDLMQLHLDDPRNAQYAREQDYKGQHAGDGVEAREFSNVELMGGMAGALLRWGRSGFRGLDEATASARLEICRSCPHLVEAPDRFFYKVKLAKKSDQRVCGKCGCVATRKVKVATERCPVGLWGPAA
jgi:hypothetical protein